MAAEARRWIKRQSGYDIFTRNGQECHYRGAIEQSRNITNNVVANGSTNQTFLPSTDSSNQVRFFSSRGMWALALKAMPAASSPM